MTGFEQWLSEKLGESIENVKKLELTARGTLNAHAFYEASAKTRNTASDKGGDIYRLVSRQALSPAFPGRNPNGVQHAIQSRLYDRGLLVPASLGVFDDQHFMMFTEGLGSPEAIVTEGVSAGLVNKLAGQIARLHQTSPEGLDLESWHGKSLALAQAVPAGPEQERFIALIEQAGDFVQTTALVHNDFRTGNFLVNKGELTGLLDFDLVCTGDPLMDLAWFCGTRWRYQRQDLEAGGLVSQNAFLKAYETQSGKTVDRAAFAFWQKFVQARTDVMGIVQAGRGFGWKV